MNPCTPKREVRLCTLLPYDPAQRKNGQLIASLHEYELLVTATQQALAAAVLGHFEQFDALVGENMCQIRAVKIAAMIPSILKHLTESPLQQQLQAIQENLPAQREALKKAPRGCLDGLLKKKKLEILLTPDEVFLVQSYLLTQSKEVKSPTTETPLLAHEVTMPKKLMSLSPVTGSFAEALIKKTRRDLSFASVNFVQACMDRRAPMMEYKGCYSLPFFFTNEALMQYAYQENLSLVLEVVQVSPNSPQPLSPYRLPFIPTEEGYRYAPGTSLDSPEIIMKGFMQANYPKKRSEVIQAITTQGPVNLFLYNSATHRQSMDPAKEEEVLASLHLHPHFPVYREEGKKAGCSLDNPSLFFIHHVFCNSIQRQEKLHQKEIRAQIKQDLSMRQGGR